MGHFRIEQERILAIAAISQVLTYFIPFRQMPPYSGLPYENIECKIQGHV